MSDTTNKNGYYDFDIDLDELLSGGGMIEEFFYVQDLKQRKYFLIDEISQSTVADIVRHILQINREDAGIPPEERKPILLYLDTYGGEEAAGFQLIDAIQASKTPVYTINTGVWFSMGFLIGIAGHKRFATKHAKFLMHDGSCGIFDSTSKVRDQIEFNNRVEQRIKQYVLECSNITAKEYDKNTRVEWYMFASEAKEKGFIDAIIGEDVDLDAII